jgi:hypothetical protein
LRSSLSTADERLTQLRHWARRRRTPLEFWRRSQEDYLHTLHARGKWHRRESNLRIDDAVAFKDKNLPPTQWLLGGIMKLHPGADGLLRNATLCYAHGSLSRPVQQLCQRLINLRFRRGGCLGLR